MHVILLINFSLCLTGKIPKVNLINLLSKLSAFLRQNRVRASAKWAPYAMGFLSRYGPFGRRMKKAWREDPMTRREGPRKEELAYL